jgi:DNA-directed RNA polymerase specialized sigma24 family protein
MFWTITDEQLLSAQAGDAGAIQLLFAQAMPSCARLATSLTGSRVQAKRVSRDLVKRAAGMVERWRDAEDASRWFMHHLILRVRHHRRPVPIEHDMLIEDIGGPDIVPYRAMITALRKLPEQQQEAFILTHAQKWNTRYCAIAMDCSNTAVETHLNEANRTIQPLLGKNFEALCGFLHQVHKSLPIDLPDSPGMIATRIKARRGFGAIMRIIGWAMILLIVAAIIYAVVVLVPRIEI